MSSFTVLEQRLSELLAERLSLDVADPSLDLLETGLLDSLSLIELLVVLDEHFDVQVSVEDLQIEDFRTIKSIAARIASESPRAKSNALGYESVN